MGHAKKNTENTDKSDIEIPKQLQPYFRKTIAHPEGQITHYGDCAIYSLAKVCDCGLIRTLLPMDDAEKWHANFRVECDNHIDTLEELQYRQI